MMNFRIKKLLEMKSSDDMLEILNKYGNSKSLYKKGTKINVWNKMERNGYSYILSEPMGKNMEFSPELSPYEMLLAGVFEGKYMNDCILEYPKEWFIKPIKYGKMSLVADPSVNLFKLKSRSNLNVWVENNWLPNIENKNDNTDEKKNSHRNIILSDKTKNHDVRCWFQWYCRYWLGRRNPEIDEIQIKRWNMFKRHKAQIVKNCTKKNCNKCNNYDEEKNNIYDLCRPRQRQALLQWAYNPYF